MSINTKNYNPDQAQLQIGFTSGSGAPNFVASKGTLYVNLDGTTTNDRLYVNTDGATAFTSITTAA
jgi:hypothetical protein